MSSARREFPLGNCFSLAVFLAATVVSSARVQGPHDGPLGAVATPDAEQTAVAPMPASEPQCYLKGAADSFSLSDINDTDCHASRDGLAKAVVYVFGGEKLQSLRARAQKAAKLAVAPADYSQGGTEPMQIVAAFPVLRVKERVLLRGYTTSFGIGGCGAVWAFPKEGTYPGKNGVSDETVAAILAQGPANGFGDAMEAIQGDGSPWSYLCASILHRELKEFGAWWHGQYWATHTIVFADPWKSDKIHRDAYFLDDPPTPPDQWEWLEPQPGDWRPRVEADDQKVTVTFYTYSPLGQEAIYRHVDTFRKGCCRPTTDEARLARGPRHMVF